MQVNKNKTHKRLVKSILAENKAFAKMSKKKKRVKIAQDVIEAMKVQYITPCRDSYGTFKGLKEKYKYNGAMNPSKAPKAFESISCKACALGSMFVTSLLNYDGEHFNRVDIDCMNNIYNELTETFSSKQIAIIEHAFEGWDSEYLDDAGLLASMDVELNISDEKSLAKQTYKWHNKCVKNFDKLKKDNVWDIDETDYLLYSIMRNIIENDGKFDISYTKFPKVTSFKDMKSYVH